MSQTKNLLNDRINVGAQYFYWLDALRFIAAFMVLLSHSRNTFFYAFSELPYEQHNIFTMVFTMFCRMGHEAVVIFFVLSGFLVGGRGIERLANGRMNVASYAIDRISRIYPPLLMAIVFYAITCFILPEYTFDVQTAFGNLLNLQGICCDSLVTPFWSLSYEVWFYIAFGVASILLMAETDTQKVVRLILLVASLSVFVMGLSMHYLLIWIMGALAYIVRPNKRNKWLLLLGFMGFFSCVLYWQVSKDTHTLEFAIVNTNKHLVELVMSFSACILVQQLVLFKPSSKFMQYIESRGGKLACFSYTLYLSHRIIFLWIQSYIVEPNSCDFSTHGFLKFILVIVLSTLLCWLLYFISEKHTPKVKAVLKRLFLK